MDSLQDSSIKIKKKSRNTNVGDRNFLCGGCNRAYKSYPALYLHIKRKHDGVRPLNTKAAKPALSISRDKIHTGRPQKPSHDVDGVAEDQIYLENAQSELLGFIGERLKLISSMDAKPKLEAIVQGITDLPNEAKEDAMVQLKEEIQNLFKDLKEKNTSTFDIEMDYDNFHNLDRENSLRILSWFLLWIGKYILKFEALRDLTFIFSKVWKILSQKDLQIQDLDNKLVWNGVMKECDPYLATFTSFEGKKELISEFINKMCHLIGKIFE